MSEKMEEIINFYGIEKQCNQAMEECAELIVAVNKCLRYPQDTKRRDDLIEEIADVIIMIGQLSSIFDIYREEIDLMIDMKEKRIVKRYEHEKMKKEQEQQYGVQRNGIYPVFNDADIIYTRTDHWNKDAMENMEVEKWITQMY